MENAYDAVVLDLGLPDIDGFTVCHRCARRTAGRRCSCSPPWTGSTSGSAGWMSARMIPGQTVRVRRTARPPASPATPRRGTAPAQLIVGDLVLDPATHTVTRGLSPIELTGKEFELLAYLMRYPDQVLSRPGWSTTCGNPAYDGDLHIVNVYIAYLRDKIDRPFGRGSLQTVRSAGFRIRDDRGDDERPEDA